MTRRGICIGPLGQDFIDAQDELSVQEFMVGRCRLTL